MADLCRCTGTEKETATELAHKAGSQPTVRQLPNKGQMFHSCSAEVIALKLKKSIEKGVAKVTRARRLIISRNI